MFGHTQESYKKNEQQKKEWRIKSNISSQITQQPQAHAHYPTQQITDAETGEAHDFQRVTKGATKGNPSHTQQNIIRMDCTLLIANSF